MVVDAIRNGSPSLNIDRHAWEKLYTALYLATAEDFGERTIDGMKADLGLETKSIWEQFGKVVKKVIGEQVARQVQHITETTQEQIQKAIQAGLSEDEDFPTIAKRIDKLYLDQIIPNRSMLIARTEVLTASSLGSRYAAKELGVPVTKEWVSTPDNHTRDKHRHANGQNRGLDEPYLIGGVAMMYPGDPAGGAGNVINCRCMEIYHTGRPGGEEPAFLRQGEHYLDLNTELSEEETQSVIGAGDKLGVDSFLAKNPLKKISLEKKVVWSDEEYGGYCLHGDLHASANWPERTEAPEFKPGETWTVADAAKTRLEATERAFIHELSHHIHEYGGPVVKQIVRTAARRGKSITAYGAAYGEEEYFSESVSAFVYHHDDLKKFDQVGYDMVKAVLDLLRGPK